tara:strand:- start:1003 stop:1254 length:252 start_codon:yes stop_codon:yes gene_type:complete
MTNEEINQTIVDENNKQMQEIRNEKPEMTLSKALQALSEIENHDLRMHLIDVVADLANDQFKKGMSISEDIWRPRDINQESNN